MSRYVENTQLAELANILWAIGFATFIFICARVLHSALRKAKRLIHPPGRWRLPRRGGDAGSAVASPSYFMDGIFAGDDDWPAR